MTKTNTTPRAAAKKAADLIRHGKSLTSLLTVYERMHTGEIACTKEGLEAIKTSILCKTGEIAELILN